MEQKYLIDTNVIIDYFGNKLPVQTTLFLSKLDNLIISTVTQIELLGWRNATVQQLQPIYNFMKIVTILPINEAVVDKTIFIRQNKKISLGDAIIAATALEYNLSLMTRNVDDFKNIPNMQIINPYHI